MNDTMDRLNRERASLMGPEGVGHEEPVALYGMAIAELKAKDQEIDNLRAFIKGISINCANMLR